MNRGSQKKKRLAIRLDANASVGMGHLVRCSALAEALRADFELFWFTGGDAALVARFLEAVDSVIALPAGNDALDELPVFEEHLQLLAINTVLTDSYELSVAYLQFLRDHGCYVVSIDDNNLLNYPSHMVINGNFHAEQLAYQQVYPECRWLLGSNFTLLRRQFSDHDGKDINAACKTILISMGGSAATGVLIEAITMVERLALFDRVLLFAGLSDRAQIEKTFPAPDTSLELCFYDQKTTVADFMSEADIALSAAGSTVYELSVLGIPGVTITLADNQQLVASTMNRVGALISAGSISTIDWQEVGVLLTELAGDLPKRFAMSQKMRKLTDGRGAARCAQQIYKECFLS